MPGGENEPLLFSETQYWRSRWSGWFLFAAGVWLPGFFGYALWRQLVCGVPFGGRPAPDGVLLFFGVLMSVLGLGILWLALLGRLETEVRQEALYVRHYPLTRWRRHPYGEIASCEARTYRPIREYGGWGVRGGFPGKGTAYNVSGNEGVQLVFTSGKKFLIGSQQAQALAGAIQKQMKGGTSP